MNRSQTNKIILGHYQPMYRHHTTIYGSKQLMNRPIVNLYDISGAKYISTVHLQISQRNPTSNDQHNASDSPFYDTHTKSDYKPSSEHTDSGISSYGANQSLPQIST